MTIGTDGKLINQKLLPAGYKNVTWGPAAAVVFTFVFFFLSQIVGVIILLMLAAIYGNLTGQGTDVTKLLDDTAFQFLGGLLVASALFVLIKSFLKSQQARLGSLGLKKFHPKDIAYTLAGYGFYFTGFLVISILIGAWQPDLLKQEQDIGFDRLASGLTLVPIFITLVVIPPFIEEILTRGFLYSGLRTKLSFVGSTLITSLIFAVAHLQLENSAPLVWAAAADTFILSLVLCWLREQTGSLWSPILVHGLKNSLAFITIFILNWN